MPPPPGGGGGNRGTCCVRNQQGESRDSFGDCDFINAPFPEGPAIDSIIEFMKSDNVWVASYVEAWGIATTNGVSSSTTAIGSGLGLNDFKAKSEELDACTADLGECFYVDFFEMFGCFF